MGPLAAWLISALYAFAEGLGLSGAGHVAVAGIFAPIADAPASLAQVAELGTGLGLLFAVRGPFAAMFGGGLRAATRPAVARQSPEAKDAARLLLALALAFIVIHRTWPFREAAGVPLLAGMGLGLAGLAQLSTLKSAEKPVSARPDGGPGWELTPLVGLVSGLAGGPGMSALGGLVVLFLWLRVPGERTWALALSLAGLLHVGTALAGLLPRGAGSAGPAELALALVSAFLCASVAAGYTRALLARGRFGWLGLWQIPLGLATIVYARGASVAW